MLRPTNAIRATVIATSAIYSLLVWSAGLQLPAWTRILLSALPTLFVAAVILWDVLVWRIPGIIRLRRRADLRGLWRVRLTPHPDSVIPDGGNSGPIEAFIEIRQTYWSMHVRLYTRESDSVSTAVSLLPTFETDVDTVSYLYTNRPRVAESHRSMRNDGSCTLEPRSHNPKSMTGRYFTDRSTKGDITASFVDRTHGYATFDEAAEHIAKP